MPAMLAELGTQEGRKPFVYDDATGLPISRGTIVRGNATVGMGRNLATDGLSDAEIDLLCTNDCLKFAAVLDCRIPWWRGLSPARQRQMLSLAFNMGPEELITGWPHFLAAMQSGNWQAAVDELQSSKWWHQVGQRGPMIAGQILAG
jgi:lysozyme